MARRLAHDALHTNSHRFDVLTRILLGKLVMTDSIKVLRLVATIGDQTRRWVLAPGEWVVGSAPGCDVRLRHPSISRRHASIRVDTEDTSRVQLEDLESKNGTALDGRRVVRAEIPIGGQLRLGSVDVVLESVAETDLEPAVSFADADDPAEPRSKTRAPEATTLAASWFQAFFFEHLPDLIRRAAEEPSREELARSLGAALFRGLPCIGVEIAREDRGIVFTAGEQAPEPGRRPTFGAGSLTSKCPWPSIDRAQKEPSAGSSTPSCRSWTWRPTTSAKPSGPAGSPPKPPDPPTLAPEMRSIYQRAARIAPADLCVLVRGESGTGKELLARYLHEASGREGWVELNCAALPRDLLEAELFGVERGAATGVDARAGKLELAHGGTLFLDEIGDMSLDTQAKILRALQERRVHRLGGHQPRAAEARIVAATNRDLEEMMEEGTFRRDLYHRIADWEVELPPLRRRRVDVPNLAAHFLERACRTRGVACRGLSRAVVERLAAYSWPGNVRQLEREMKRAAYDLEDGELLETRHLHPDIDETQPAADDTLKRRVEWFERREIRKALARHEGDVTRAAADLGLSRSSLYRRIKSLGLGAG